MAFMQPEVTEAQFFEVETRDGTEYVPADCARLPFRVVFSAGGIFDEDSPEFPALVRALTPYVEGRDISEVRPRAGWLARMSAPGYMDCTDWTAHASEAEARAYLSETYGDE